MVDRFINIFTSLRLTVVCLVLAVVLVFVGTLAQVDLGLYATQEKFFRSFFVFWTPNGTSLKIPVLPGGWLLGLLLLMNLLAAHIKRFNLSRKKIGILCIHAGLILLLGGQFLTELFQQESQMRIEVGDTKYYSESGRKYELAVVDTTDPKNDRVVAIPESLLATGGDIKTPDLPFTLKVKKFYTNSVPAGPMTAGPEKISTTNAITKMLMFSPTAETRTMDSVDLPSALVEVDSDKGALGEFSVSAWLTRYPSFTNFTNMGAFLPGLKGTDAQADATVPQNFAFNGRTYTIALRPVRYYNPYGVRLIAFNHDLYPGTDTPINFSSKIRLNDPTTGDDRDILIYMNNPLRYRGATFFQASFEPGDGGTILQVVHNPASLAPYIACSLVALGLVIHFLMTLFGFARKQMQKPGTAPAPKKVNGAKVLEPAMTSSKGRNA